MIITKRARKPKPRDQICRVSAGEMRFYHHPVIVTAISIKILEPYGHNTISLYTLYEHECVHKTKADNLDYVHII